jgi:branched-chain amino acid transport system permease protein
VTAAGPGGPAAGGSGTVVGLAGDDAAVPLPGTRGHGVAGTLLGVAVLVVLAVVPLLDVRVPAVVPGLVSSPGALQVLAIGLVFAGLAMSYDVVFGYTGLLSFGHALFFGLAVYGTNLLMDRAGLPYAAAGVLAVVLTGIAAVLLGAVALRARGVAFAMVTLAFVEAFGIFLVTDPARITGGEEGLPLATAHVPAVFRGVVNASNQYWLALAFAGATYAVVRLVTTSSAGKVWQAVRENENRVELLGIRPYPVKLLAFVVGAVLAAAGGSVYLLLVRGANPGVASAEFSLALLVMVVLGGSGRLWGAALGGLLYGVLTLRLPALSSSGILAPLPDGLEGVIAEPLFVLGLLFILLVLFAPSGVAGVVDRLRAALTRGGSR